MRVKQAPQNQQESVGLIPLDLKRQWAHTETQQCSV